MLLTFTQIFDYFSLSILVVFYFGNVFLKFFKQVTKLGFELLIRILKFVELAIKLRFFTSEDLLNFD